MIRNIASTLKRLIQGSSDHSSLIGLSDADRQLVERIRAEKLTYLSNKKLASLIETCRSIEASKIDGIFLEAGCALGGSAIMLASIKRNARRLNVYDVFGMIPPPTQEDSQDVHDRYKIIVQGQSKGIDGEVYYGYIADLEQVVKQNFSKFNIDLEEQSVTLIKGLVQDTLHIDRPIAFAHVDVDWYDPVKTCLERISPRLVPGGSIILDDYHDWGGCRKATDEFLRTVTGQFSLDDSAGSLRLTKRSG